MNLIYKDGVELRLKKDGNWQIRSDQMWTWETQPVWQKHAVTEWVNQRPKNEMRDWQHGITISETVSVFGDIKIFLIYQKFHGYKQEHDMCLVKPLHYPIWVFSTAEDFWIQPCPEESQTVQFHKTSSLGSILNANHRKIIYEYFDELKKDLNPRNVCLTLR